MPHLSYLASELGRGKMEPPCGSHELYLVLGIQALSDPMHPETEGFTLTC